MSTFITKHSFDERKKESIRVLKKYDHRIPIIIEKSEHCTNIPKLDKIKYIVPNDLTFGQFIYIIRKRLQLSPEKALFIFNNNTLFPSSENIGTIYHTYKHEDGFLYMSYSAENTFG